MSEHIKEVSDSNFDQDVLQSDVPVLVDFWAEWCGPCRMLTPTVEAVAAQYAGRARVVKLNIDESPSITQRYGVRGVPTLILFTNGKEEERIVGVTSQETISQLLDTHIGAAVH